MDVSRHGLSVKTDKRFDRERYLDATQRSVRCFLRHDPGSTLVLTQLQNVRGFIKAFNASSAGNRPASGSVDEDSSTSRGKRGVFGRRAYTPEDK